MARSYVAAIAGLRSIAVLSIVLYHLDPAWIPGGFVGVDIFFVISGFVVAHSVMNASHDSFLSYVGWFYKRRFQRILPAAFLYIAVAAVLSLIFIPLAPATKFLEVTGAAATFALSNIILWMKTGDYFAASSELNLFTHTWSLAVEEQYYLFFPFISYPLLISKSAGPRTRRAVLALFAVACIGSLAAAALLSKRAPTFAFYMLPTRFWELGIGFLLRVWLTEANVTWFAGRTRVFAPLLAAIAIMALTMALILTDPSRFPFPGAVLPCVATVLLIAVVWCHPGVWVDRLLSMSLPVWFGNISYSLYLWHWGVIVLMRWTVGIGTLPLRLIALVAMLALSYISYAYVEKAFHNSGQRARAPSLRFFLSYGLAAGIVASICVASYLAKPVAGLAAADEVAIWDPYGRPPLPADCPVDKKVGAFGAGQITTFPTKCTDPGAPHLFIVGDSHAGAYQRTAWRIAGTGRYRVTLIALGGCRPILLSTLPSIAGCSAFLDKVREKIRAVAKSGDVLFLPGLQTTKYRTQNGDPLAAKPLEPAVIAESRARLRAFMNLGPAVVVEAAKPVAFFELYRCSDWFNRGNAACRPIAGASPSETLRRLALANRGIDMVVDGLPVTLWKPAPFLCPHGECPAYIDGKPLYFDSDHLSAYGNDRVLEPLLAMIDAAHRRAMDSAVRARMTRGTDASVSGR